MNPTQPEFKFDPVDDDFGALVNCAVRYCLGRCTYMPSLICDYLKPRLSLLNAKTIGCMERDIRLASSYRDECDRATWAAFLGAVQSEMERRKIRPWP